MSIRVICFLAAFVLGGPGVLLLGDAAFLRTKGWLAERLILRAWREHLHDGAIHRPWAWADLFPVAELRVPQRGIRRMVLSTAAGSGMAYGLGHLDGTAEPGRSGNVVLVGHRDKWARFMEELETGDEVRLDIRGGSRLYRVARCEVVPREATEVAGRWGGDRLTMITCYPFGGLTRSRWRYVITCVPETNGTVE